MKRVSDLGSARLYKIHLETDITQCKRHTYLRDLTVLLSCGRRTITENTWNCVYRVVRWYWARKNDLTYLAG